MPETPQTIDLLSPSTVFVNRLPDMTGVVERLFRHFRSLLFQEFRYNLQAVDERFSIVSHDEYLGSRNGYNLYGILNIPSIKGRSLIILEGALLAALVDDLFGADRPTPPELEGPQISLMETRIGRHIMDMLVTALEVAFQQYFEAKGEVVRIEGFSTLATVADANEPFCVISGALRLPTGGGTVSIGTPYRGLEVYREVLGSPIGAQAEKEAQSQWTDRAAAAIDDVPVEIGFEIGSVLMSAGAMAALAVGDVLPLTLHRSARAVVGDASIGPITYGAVGPNYGVYFGNDHEEQ